MIKNKLKPNGYLVIEVCNIVNENITTTLAWDIGKAVSEIFCLKREIIIDWSGGELDLEYGYGYNHSYCLVFQNTI